MATASIGIKLADSKFFPVLDEGVPASKILELTTVRDDQSSVQINLFRSETGTIDDATYVGTLIIEDILPRKMGEPTIDLTLTLDDQNELSAEAVDLESGTRQVLTVSLETLESESLFNLPDFDLTPIDASIHLGDDPEHENLVIQGAIPGNAPEGLYEMHDENERKSGIFMPAWLCILILVIGVAALVLALLVSARTMLASRAAPSTVVEAPAVPTVEPTPPPVESAPAEKTPAPEETVTSLPAETPAAEAPAATVVEESAAPAQPEPAPEAKEIKLKLKWGDTLWDISESYYRTPWDYKKIAKHNKIKNPNLIIAGTYINIPAK